MPTRLQLARDNITRVFEKEPTRIYRQRDLERILAVHRDEWRLAQRTTLNDFLQYLLKSRKLRRLEFPFPHRKEVRFTWGRGPLHAVLLTLKPGAHFSHFTAMQLLDLTEQDPTTIYLNHEQPPKPAPSVGLAQERIDLAFRRKPRATRNVAVIKARGQRSVRVCLLNGKSTGYLGVEEREVRPTGEEDSLALRLTDIERTLIDCAVRPFYAGGVAQVLQAYRRAAGRASVNRLAAFLRRLDYVYPYHQAIGFYLEAGGGYEADALDFFHKKFEYQFDFYLTYGMDDTEYVPRWRIHVPRGLRPLEH